MRNFLKNILIFILFILAVYQTTTLWFDNFSIGSIMPIFNEREISTTDSMDYILDRLIVNVGDNKIVGKTNDIYESQYKTVFDKGVAEAVNSGDKINLGQFDWKNILKGRAVIYEYNCVFSSNEIPEMFEGSIDKDKVNEITNFDNVIILPDTNNTLMTVIFYNSVENKYTAKSVKNEEIKTEIYSYSTKFANENSTNYISSAQSGFDIFSDNVFIPGLQENSMEYYAVEAEGIYTDESMAEKNADDFFDNPVAKWSANENNALTYSDENTVIKYDKTSNVFEYSNYRVSDSNDSALGANYITAVNTIGQDSFVKNEVYLHSYDNNNGKYVFRFNYKINDRILVPSEEMKQKTGMTAFIEITTEGGRLDKYKKYAYSYKNAEVSKTADCDFVTAIDKVYSEEKVDNIDLCYIAEQGEDIGLKWIIDIGENSYIVSSERE